jgi:hypothetical protein
MSVSHGGVCVCVCCLYVCVWMGMSDMHTAITHRFFLVQLTRPAIASVATMLTAVTRTTSLVFVSSTTGTLVSGALALEELVPPSLEPLVPALV